MREHLRDVEQRNDAVLDAVADRLHDVVRGDGLVYVAGTGHSTALILECFYRAGGLACVYPLYHPALLPLEGPAEATLLERSSGLAAALLGGAEPGPGDIAFVFSNSGVNAVPVELAERLGAAGTPVCAVVSRAHMEAAPARVGRKLADLADHVVDTRVPPGDASWAVGDDAAATVPLSSLSGAYCWNLLLARLADRALAAGTPLPLWTSGNVPGGDEDNAALLARYRRRIPALQ